MVDGGRQKCKKIINRRVALYHRNVIKIWNQQKSLQKLSRSNKNRMIKVNEKIAHLLESSDSSKDN